MSRPHAAHAARPAHEDLSDAERITICPNCGSGNFVCNHIDEGPYREAAR